MTRLSGVRKDFIAAIPGGYTILGYVWGMGAPGDMTCVPWCDTCQVLVIVVLMTPRVMSGWHGS